MAWVLLSRSAHQALKVSPWIKSYSIVWHISHLKGTLGGVLLCSSVSQEFDAPVSLLFSCPCWRVGRGLGDGSTPMRDSAVLPCFQGCQAFLHSHFSSQSPLSAPLNPSLCSQQQPSLWDCSTIPKLQFLATAHSRRPMSLPGMCVAPARTV